VPNSDGSDELPTTFRTTTTMLLHGQFMVAKDRIEIDSLTVFLQLFSTIWADISSGSINIVCSANNAFCFDSKDICS